MKKHRVVIADDSVFMRKQIKRFVEEERNLEVVGLAANGREAIEIIKIQKPDLLLLDIEMPIMNGLVTLAYLMKNLPLPIIIISGHIKDSSINSLVALEHGAIDIIVKPQGSISTNIESIKEEISTKVRAALSANIEKVDRVLESTIPLKPTIFDKQIPTYALVIGSSSGGILALEGLLTQFPENFPCSIFVAQHLPEGFTHELAQRLDSQCNLKVCEAVNGQAVKRGVIYFAPGGKHMRLALVNGEIRISIYDSKEYPQEHFVPSIDLLMKSVTQIYAGNTIGVILSGMGVDGVEGLKEIYERGGHCISEDKSTAVIDGMTRAARDSGYTHKDIPVYLIAEEIISHIQNNKTKNLQREAA
jgi:two-component system, chemotaxis family, protein-glutamate methylesterase/glutaminase